MFRQSYINREPTDCGRSHGPSPEMTPLIFWRPVSILSSTGRPRRDTSCFSSFWLRERSRYSLEREKILVFSHWASRCRQLTLPKWTRWESSDSACTDEGQGWAAFGSGPLCELLLWRQPTLESPNPWQKIERVLFLSHGARELWDQVSTVRLAGRKKIKI